MADLNFLSDLLSGLKTMGAHHGLSPIAQSRITRTPIYEDSLLRPVTPGADASYRDGGYIAIGQKKLQNSTLIPHESAHDLYDRAGLGKTAAQLLQGPSPALRAFQVLNGNPEVYPDLTPDMLANEGLAYSIGQPDGTPYVEHVAQQIKDPAIAQQLLRLHRNAMGSKGAGY